MKLIQSVIDGEKLDPTYDGNASDVHKVTQSSSQSSSQSSNSSSNNSNTNPQTNTEGMKASLGRTTVTLTEGDTFTYYGYTLSYDGVDVTKNSGVKENFIINGKNYDNYKDLVFYVSKLDKGNYTITYEITYQGYIVKDTQNVEIIEKIEDNSKPNGDDSLDNEGNNDNSSTKKDDNLENSEDNDSYLEDE